MYYKSSPVIFNEYNRLNIYIYSLRKGEFKMSELMTYEKNLIIDEITRLIDLLPEHGKEYITSEMVDYIEEIVEDQRGEENEKLVDEYEEQIEELESTQESLIEFKEETERQKMLAQFYFYV